jgi:hypothetical protein
MRIEIDGVFEAFDAALQLLPDEAQRDTVRRVLSVSRDSVQRAVHEVVSQVADEVNESSGGALHVTLHDVPGALDLEVNTTPLSAPPGEETADLFEDSEIERLTLRLPAELKDIAALAAEQAGVSLNTWLTRLVSREAVPRPGSQPHGQHGRKHGPGGGQSVKGWIGG